MLQRFGSALNLNVHFHILVPDGAWVLGPGATPRGPDPAFRSVRGPTTHDVEDLVVQLADACERFLDHMGFGEGEGGDDPNDAQVLLEQASLAGVAALGRRAGRQAPARGPAACKSTRAARSCSLRAAPPATATTRSRGRPPRRRPGGTLRPPGPRTPVPLRLQASPCPRRPRDRRGFGSCRVSRLGHPHPPGPALRPRPCGPDRPGTVRPGPASSLLAPPAP
ncbi:MAG: transposase [Deltaproteobacteria bacterium]|nr:transposase [Deltaproteobacteria bacterium]